MALVADAEAEFADGTALAQGAAFAQDADERWLNCRACVCHCPEGQCCFQLGGGEVCWRLGGGMVECRAGR